MIVTWAGVIDELQRSIEPRGFTLARRRDGGTCSLTCFYGEAGYPVAFIGEEKGLAWSNKVAQKEAARKLRAACELYAGQLKTRR